MRSVNAVDGVGRAGFVFSKLPHLAATANQGENAEAGNPPGM
jgi:hypothetical protein